LQCTGRGTAVAQFEWQVRHREEMTFAPKDHRHVSTADSVFLAVEWT
jgi:hypothetical protein